VGSFYDVWYQFVGFLPNLVGALVIFLAGVLVAMILERLVERLFRYLKVDALLLKANVGEVMHGVGLQLNTGYFLGKVVYWLVFLSFVLAASDVLGFNALSGFIGSILLYIPNIAVAFLIMVVTLIVAEFLKKLAMASVLGAKLHSAHFLGSLTWWTVFVFGILTTLGQLGVAVSVVNSLIVGLIATFALAGGLAFGLGGKEEAARLLAKLRSDWEHK
jgi:hypothetical protein